MFDIGLNAVQLDHLAMLLAFAVLFLFGAGVRVRFDRLRFSLRTLLIFTTMVGLALGAAVYAVK